MSTQILLELPDNLYHSAEKLAGGLQQPVQTVLTEFLTVALGNWGGMKEPISLLSNEELLQLSNAQMDERQSERFSELLYRQQADTLTAEEKPELWALARIYELGQLRRAEAMAEASRRRLLDL
jgi:hypothetical protein